MQSLEQLKINIETKEEVQRIVFPAKQLLSFLKVQSFVLKNQFQASIQKLQNHQNELIEFSLSIDIEALKHWLQDRLVGTNFKLIELKQKNGIFFIKGCLTLNQEIPFLLEGQFLASHKELRFECYHGIYLGLQDQYLEQYELNQSMTLNLTSLIVHFFKALKLPTSPQNLAVIQIDLLTELSLNFCLEAGFKLPKRVLIPSFRFTENQLEIYGKAGEINRTGIDQKHKQYLDGLRLFYENEKLITQGLIEEAFYAYSMAQHPFAYQRVLELCLYLKNERPKIKHYIHQFRDKIDQGLCYQARYHDLELQYQSEVFFSTDLPSHQQQLVLLIDWMKEILVAEGEMLFSDQLFDRFVFEMIFQQWLKLLKEDHARYPDQVALVLDYLYQQNDFMDAIAKLDIYDQLVDMELGLNRVNEAVLLIEQQVEMARLQANQSQVALSLVKLGEIYKPIDINKAQSYYQQSIETKPQQVLAYQAKAVLFEELGDLYEARKSYADALKYSSTAKNIQQFKKEIENKLFDLDQRIFVEREFSHLDEDLPDGNTAAINRLASGFKKVLPEDPMKKLKEIDFSLPQPNKPDAKIIEQRLNQLHNKNHVVESAPVESAPVESVPVESAPVEPTQEKSAAFEHFQFSFEDEPEDDFENLTLANELKIQETLQKIKSTQHKDSGVGFKKLESVLTPNSKKRELSAEELALKNQKEQLLQNIETASNRLQKNKAKFEYAVFLRDEVLDFEVAEKIFLEILDDAPLNQHEILEESIAYLTEKYTSLQSYQDLVELYQKQIKKNFPNQPFLYLQKAAYHVELKEFYLALDAIQQAKIKLDQIKNQKHEYQKQKNKLQGILELELKVLEQLNKHDEILELLTQDVDLSEDEIQYRNLLCARYIAKQEPKQALDLYQSLYQQIDDRYFKESVYEEWYELCEKLDDPTLKVPLVDIEAQKIDEQINLLEEQSDINKQIRKKSKLYSRLASELEDQAPMVAMELYQRAFQVWADDFDSAEKVCILAKIQKKYEILINTLNILISQCLEGEGKGKYLLELAGCYLILGNLNESKRYADLAYQELKGDIFDPQSLVDILTWIKTTMIENQMDLKRVDAMLQMFTDHQIGEAYWQKLVEEQGDF